MLGNEELYCGVDHGDDDLFAIMQCVVDVQVVLVELGVSRVHIRDIHLYCVVSRRGVGEPCTLCAHRCVQHRSGAEYVFLLQLSQVSEV